MEVEILTSISTEIRKANDKFETVFNSGDAAGMAALYTEDGMLLPAGTDIIKGKDGIQQFWQGAMDIGIKKAKLQTIELEQLEDTVIELGKYSLAAADGQELDQGKYMVIWKKENDAWKLQKDIWTSSKSAV